MRRLTFLLILLSAVTYTHSQIIADHTIVDEYENIPQQYIDSVKKMWVTVPGESHSSGYRIGLRLLQEADDIYNVNVRESGTPDGATDTCLRFSRASWGNVNSTSGWIYGYGEEDWFTSQTAIDNTINGIVYTNTNGPSLRATGFGWCWDMTSPGAGGDIDPGFQVRWAGRSSGGPEGSNIWGLDKGDSALTSNSVCMDTYINATMAYIKLCSDSGYPTKAFFTTGPVDGGGNTGENGYQRYIKHEYIRNFVKNTDSLILFDYADILCWGDDTTQSTTTWTDYGGSPQTYQHIHPNNMLDLDGTYAEDGDHIGERGSLRLAKAMWWMLARMAGWEGNITEYHTNLHPDICDGGSYFAEGADQTATGVYYDTLTAVSNGLDSIIITHLTVNPVYNYTVDTTILKGGSYFAGGTLQTTSGTYYDSLLSISNCDSIITTKLTVESDHDTLFVVTICEGESYYAEGENQTSTGIYFDTLQSSTGNDSIIKTDLTVNPVYKNTKNRAISEGESYFAGGDYQTTTGTYYDSLTTIDGCDSIIITNLTVEPVVDIIASNSDDGIWIHPNPTNGKFQFELKNINGDVSVNIVSVVGETIIRKECKEIIGTIQDSFELSDFNEGIYFIMITSNKGTKVGRIIYLRP